MWSGPNQTLTRSELGSAPAVGMPGFGILGFSVVWPLLLVLSSLGAECPSPKKVNLLKHGRVI